MLQNMFDAQGMFLSVPLLGKIIIVLLSLWTLAWKGLALWHSAQRKEKWWFIALLLINTVGILEIIYLFAVVKLHKTGNVFGLAKNTKTSGTSHTS